MNSFFFFFASSISGSSEDEEPVTKRNVRRKTQRRTLGVYITVPKSNNKKLPHILVPLECDL